MRSATRRWASVLLAVLLACAACSSTEEKQGHRGLQDLVGSLEHLGSQLQQARADLIAAVVDHDALLNLRDADIEDRYRDFTRHLSACEARQERLLKQSDEVIANAQTYFGRWEEELALLETEDLRDASAKDLRKMRRQYEDLRDELAAVGALFHPLLATLRDHATFLNVDLNRESLASLTKDMGSVQADAARLYRAVDEASIATHTFIGAVRE
jgi:hypothetical protein